MAPTTQDIARLASLARLELDDAQRAQAANDLAAFLATAAAVQAQDTTGVAPLTHVLSLTMPQAALGLQADVVSEPNLRELYLRNAPAADRGLFLVPKVIE